MTVRVAGAPPHRHRHATPRIRRWRQLFRLKASFPIPANLQHAVQGDPAGDEDLRHVPRRRRLGLVHQGEPSASWDDNTFTEVQSVTGDNFEAVDITAITSRAGFDPNSGAVP